ncbi:GNAT family N-acetyltransferase [Brevibacterium sp. 5221]|uniref:GNAT family N-acetyltransferase n=1 Tax=Brevibacterium rongguiense TaxID=2695267 RepID=A0A6N9HB71_9MICO|nr:MULTISPECIES: GNAT family protein [Brevibacterium]MYM20734.1 GNAT family N-acetyltransferase [Brevibacterium rongguiense]WAL41046.1 GNAT family protein [Brevibacterium sp. BRM-1]
MSEPPAAAREATAHDEPRRDAPDPARPAGPDGADEVDAPGGVDALGRLWPPFGLRIVSPRLVLRLVREADFPAYVAAAASGVVRTARNPFAHAWNEQPPAELARSSLPWLWSKRAAVGPNDWYLFLAVFLRDSDGGEGRLIGMQDVGARDWPVLATVTSASWLRADEQGNGYGSEMRAAMLLWAFDHFGAAFAESGAYDWNAASLAVSATQGYERVGTTRVVDAHGTAPETQVELRLAATDFRRPEWTVQVRGSAELAAFFAGEPPPAANDTAAGGTAGAPGTEAAPGSA